MVKVEEAMSLSLTSQENYPATRTSEAQPRFKQEGNPASWIQSSFPSWTLCPHPLPPPAGSLVALAWASLACNICSSCGNPDGQMSGFASNRGEKGEMRCLGRERGTGDRDYAVCLLATSCWGASLLAASGQAPGSFHPLGHDFPAPCLREGQLHPSFSDF